MTKLLTFARYGARINKDLGRALQAPRVLRDRPDAWIDELQNGTPEPGSPEPQQQNCTNDLSPCTSEPEHQESHEEKYTNELSAGTLEPEPANANLELCTPESGPSARNRHQHRRLEALARRAQGRAA